MAQEQEPYTITLSLELYKILRQYVRRENAAWKAVDLALTNSDSSVSFDCTSAEITSLIDDLSYQLDGAPVIAELIKQGSQAHEDPANKR